MACGGPGSGRPPMGRAGGPSPGSRGNGSGSGSDKMSLASSFCFRSPSTVLGCRFIRGQDAFDSEWLFGGLPTRASVAPRVGQLL